jgi:adenosylmethionine---8-amino-7-oxononanoate aminotransferase
MGLQTHPQVRRSLAKRDRDVIWHPFSKSHSQAIPIARGKGVYLFDDNGKAYLDAISSWWVNLHGHAHPYMIEKINAQLQILEHVIFTGFTHQPAIELAERLTTLTGMDKIFYTDNGSTAIETALKMALQYSKRRKVLSLRGGYHGETFGAMSAAGKNRFNAPFWRPVFPVASIDPPFAGNEEQFLKELKHQLSSGEIAAFIFEPLILGPGGMRIYSREALEIAMRLCQEHDTLTIADEVMTGFGRTGPLFACPIPPDILCVAKSMTGGYLPLGAALCKQKIYDAFSDFAHGHSYAGNPLACTAALASLDLLLSPSCTEARKQIAASHRRFVDDHPSFLRCESLGTILAIEYHQPPPASHFLEQGILMRPLENVFYVIPPYCITSAELERIYGTL